MRSFIYIKDKGILLRYLILEILGKIWGGGGDMSYGGFGFRCRFSFLEIKVEFFCMCSNNVREDRFKL